MKTLETLACVALVALTASCTAQQVPAASAGVLDASVAVTTFRTFDADFERPKTLDNIVKQSDLGVAGTITDCQPGPTVGKPDDKRFRIGTNVYAVKPDRTFKGQVRSANNRVYFTLPARPGGDQCPKGPAQNARIAVYLTEFVEGTDGPEMPVQNFAAGRPSGEPIYVLTHPIGLAIESNHAGHSGITFPLAGTFAQATLEDMAPGGTALGKAETSVTA